MATLAEAFPDFAAEWDYKNNGELTPDKVPPGSHLKVNWLCPVCGQSYSMKICNRTAPSRQKKTNTCPVCLGRKIIPGFNSLKARYPKIVKLEWDYSLNSVDPDTIAPHTNKAYYWKCLNGHESYLSRVNNKVYGNGGNCPKCSHQKPSKEYSLQTLKPELAKEWDIEANDGITPDQVPAYSNKLAWWRCSICGYRWQAVIDNRSNGRGCPQCAKGHHSSLPEQAIFFFVKKAFPDAKSGYQLDGKEIDIYIPSVKIGIEYDGEAFHRTTDKLKRDIAKSNGPSDRLAGYSPLSSVISGSSAGISVGSAISCASRSRSASSRREAEIRLLPCFCRTKKTMIVGSEAKSTPSISVP